MPFQKPSCISLQNLLIYKNRESSNLARTWSSGRHGPKASNNKGSFWTVVLKSDRLIFPSRSTSIFFTISSTISFTPSSMSSSGIRTMQCLKNCWISSRSMWKARLKGGLKLCLNWLDEFVETRLWLKFFNVIFFRKKGLKKCEKVWAERQVFWHSSRNHSSCCVIASVDSGHGKCDFCIENSLYGISYDQQTTNFKLQTTNYKLLPNL